MLTEQTNRDAADDLRAAGQALAHIDEGADITGLPEQLERLAAALRTTVGASMAIDAPGRVTAPIRGEDVEERVHAAESARR